MVMRLFERSMRAGMFIMHTINSILMAGKSMDKLMRNTIHHQ